MTDEMLEQRLRRWYRSDGDTDALAPSSLRDQVLDIPAAEADVRGGRLRSWTLLAAAALIGVLAIAGMLVAGSDMLKIRGLASPAPTPPPVAPTASPTPTPTPLPTATATALATASSSATPIAPPGKLIAVYQWSGGIPKILTIDPATGEQVEIGTMPVALEPLGQNVFADTFGPADARLQWSTDHRFITVSMFADGEYPAAQFDVVSGQMEKIAPFDGGFVSPDGRLAAVLGYDPPSLQIVDLAGNLVHRIELPAQIQFLSLINWAPDGGAVVLGGYEPRPPTGQTNTGGGNGQVFADTTTGPGVVLLVPLDGSPLQQFGGTEPVGYGVGQVSPDGSAIVVDSYCEAGAEACAPELAKIDVETGDITQLTAP